MVRSKHLPKTLTREEATRHGPGSPGLQADVTEADNAGTLLIASAGNDVP